MNDAPRFDNSDSMTAIFEAMSEFYYALYIIDIKGDAFEPVRGTKATLEALRGCTSYRQAAEKFISAFVFPDDRDSARRFASPKYLASVLSPASPYCRVEVRQGQGQKFEWVAVVFKAVEFDGEGASRAVLAVENIDGMRASLQFDEQMRMRDYARKLNADAQRRIRTMSDRQNDERAAMLLKLSAQGRLLYIALQKSDAQAFEYDAAADRLSTVVEQDGGCETVTQAGGADAIAEKNRCTEKDTLAIENAFSLACDGEDAEADFISRADGEPRWKRMSLYPMRLHSVPTGTVVGVIIDIDAQKRREIFEAETKAALSARAMEEKRANQLKSRFLTNMSHELRTPLGTVLGLAQLAQREEMSPQAREYLRQLRGAGTGMLEILNGILDLARVETGGLEVCAEEYRPRELMNSLYSMFFHEAAAKSLTFDIEIDPELPSVLKGDEPHLRRALMNLLAAAFQNTEEGGVTLTMGCAGTADGFCDAAFAVWHTGFGMNGGKNCAADGENPVLGVSISRELVSLMGGELKHRSECGRGSRCYFTIRQQISDAAPGGKYIPEPAPCPSDGALWTFSAPDATVLLADDNFMNLRVGLGLLRPYGMRVITAAGGEEALRILKKERVDIVLMDQMMQDMDGLEAVGRIRAMGGEYAKLPVIAVTANAMKGAREALTSGGMDDYISKPIAMGELDEKLRRWLPQEKLMPPYTVAEMGDGAELLPRIDGVDTAKGLSFVRTLGDYHTCLRDFRCMIPEKAAVIGTAAAGGDLAACAAEMHSLRSSALLIGADGLAGMAALIEKSAREGRTEDVRRETEKMLAVYHTLYDKLEPFAEKADGGEPAFELTAEEYAAKVLELKKYVDGYDCDSADHWSEEMRLARVPAEYGESLEALRRFILAAQFSSCAALIDAIAEKAAGR